MNRFLKFKGIVEHGKKIGREIGFPTANLTNIEVDCPSCVDNMFGDPVMDLPKGVFAVYIDVNMGEDYVTSKAQRFRGMLNIGKRPTFEGLKLSVEVNVFDFSDNLYGKELIITIIDKIRDEKKFPNREELQSQLQIDKERVKDVLI